NGNVFQIQDADQHVLVLFGQHRACFIDERAQLFATQVVATVGADIQSEQLQPAGGDQVDQPDQRVHQFQAKRQDRCGWKGDTFRVGGGHRLGRHLGKNENDDGQQTCCNRDTCSAPQADGNDGGNRGSKD